MNDNKTDINEINIDDSLTNNELQKQQEQILNEANQMLLHEKQLRDSNPPKVQDNLNATNQAEKNGEKNEQSLVEKNIKVDNITDQNSNKDITSSDPNSKVDRSEEQTTNSDKEADKNDNSKTNSLNSTKDNKISVKGPTKMQDNKQAPIKSSGNNFFLFISFILVIAIVAIAYYGYTEITILKNQAQNYVSAKNEMTVATTKLNDAYSQFKALNDEENALKEINTKLQADNAQLNQKIDTLLEGIKQNEQHLNAVDNRLQVFENRNPNDWILAKAYFLISNAYEQSLQATNFKSAILDLKLADELLLNIQSKDVTELRKNIAQDLALLESQKPIDFTGISITLNEIFNNIDKLTIQSLDPLNKLNNENKEIAQETTNSWQDNLIRAAKDFSARFVEVRHRTDNSIDEFLTPAQTAILKENVKLNLNLAKTNLAYLEDEAFKSNITQALTLLKTYFDPNNQSYAFIEKNLQDLLNTQISYNLQNGISSYEVINNIMKNKFKDLNAGVNK